MDDVELPNIYFFDSEKHGGKPDLYGASPDGARPGLHSEPLDVTIWQVLGAALENFPA